MEGPEVRLERVGNKDTWILVVNGKKLFGFGWYPYEGWFTNTAGDPVEDEEVEINRRIRDD